MTQNNNTRLPILRVNITKYTHDNHPECGACPTRVVVGVCVFLIFTRKIGNVVFIQNQKTQIFTRQIFKAQIFTRQVFKAQIFTRQHFKISIQVFSYDQSQFSKSTFDIFLQIFDFNIDPSFSWYFPNKISCFFRKSVTHDSLLTACFDLNW